MTSNSNPLPHVALCPGAGIGHLVPYLRLASMLAASNTIKVTVIIVRPTLSSAETTQINLFFENYPHINMSEFHSLPCNTSDPTIDPFLKQYDAVSRSAPLLVDHITSLSPRLTAVFSDILTSGIIRPLAELGIPNFTLVVTSARFLSLMFSLLNGPIKRGKDIILPGSTPILEDELPEIMFNYEHLFVTLILKNVVHYRYSKAILINTIEYLESDALSALRSGQITKGLPPLLPVGPLHRLITDKGSSFVSWLDDKPVNSVLFVCFGSRTAMGKDQIRELGEGLKRSGVRFLWKIKTTVIDKDDTEDISTLLGDEFLESTKDVALILKEWVNQEEILDHPSIGGFLTHNGWNSLLESTRRGIPLLSWPPGGDQRVNATLMKEAGLGIWDRRWGRQGESLITADEIKDKIIELMTSDTLRESVNRVAEESRKAWEKGGSSSTNFKAIVDMVTNLTGK